MQKKRILLHACCAPCSTTAIFSLCEEYDITLCYYNPNIYPIEECEKSKLNEREDYWQEYFHAKDFGYSIK